MFHARPAVVVTMLTKDLSALMFYSSFMGQQSLNYLSTWILHVYKHVGTCVHNCSALLPADVHTFETALAILSFVIWVHFRSDELFLALFLSTTTFKVETCDCTT